ncbi:MAG: hypothetical protein R6W82_11015 [bacterium]
MHPGPQDISSDLVRQLLEGTASSSDAGRAGFLHPAASASALRHLASGAQGGLWEGMASSLASGLTHSPDPDLAVSALQALDEEADLAWMGPRRLESLLDVLGASPFLGQLLLRHPGWVRWLFESGGLDPGLRPPEAVGEEEDFTDLLRSLNLWKRRELLGIGARTILDRHTLEEEFAALSDQADLLLDLLLDRLWPGKVPRPAVVALGKLGGREINFSSDIDLLLAVALPEEAELATHLPAATRAAERLVDALTRYTELGSLFRVDLRLRPGGDRAPLVRTVRGMEAYYAARGAPWERQMLVKARICAGDPEAGGDLLRRLVPFVYPAHAETDPREEAHRLRRERRAREGEGGEDHVKLAPGGIRDIEFVVQVLQLLYGGRRPEVRSPSTLDALERLRAAGVLPGPEARALDDAYRFFRRLEHFLQMEEDRQTFTLPDPPPRRRAAARHMGRRDWPGLKDRYDSHRASVEAALRGLLPGAGEDPDGDPVESLLNLPLSGEEAVRRLRDRGFRRAGQSHRVLVSAASHIRAAGPNAWAAFVGLLPPLLRDAEETGAPDRAVNNLERVLRRLGSPGAYARLLAREERLRRALLTLCASGELLTALLVRHPEHFERMFSTLAAGAAADRAGWTRRLRGERRRAEDAARLARRLESIKTRETLAAGLSYVLGERPLDVVLEDLARLARDLLRCFLGCHLREFQSPPGAAVLSLGTLSARSMTFASDADLFFVHAAGRGPGVQAAAARAGGLLSPPGGPYPVDMRLRPEGRSAPASVDVDYLRDYLEERASPWEALALARLAPLYGRRSLLVRAVDTVESWLARFRLEPALASLRKVRGLQEEQLEGEGFDVKRSPGGMADVEFLALGIHLDAWRPGMSRPARIPELLRLGPCRRTLGDADCDFLEEHYRRLRRVQVGLQLHYGRDRTLLPPVWEDEAPAPAVLDLAAEDLSADAARVRRCLETHLPGGP